MKFSIIIAALLGLMTSDEVTAIVVNKHPSKKLHQHKAKDDKESSCSDSESESESDSEEDSAQD